MSTIDGTASDDILIGTSDSDLFKGMSGTDTAQIASARSTAAFSVDAAGRWVVTSGQGADTLESIESVQFTDSTVSVAAVAGEQRVNTTTAGDQRTPSIAGLADGGYVAVWAAADGSGNGIYVQRFDHDGSKVGGETRVNTTTADEQSMPWVTALADGGFAVAWGSVVPGSSLADIYLQRFDATGAARGSETLVNAATASGQSNPKIAALDDGGFVVAWLTMKQAQDEWEIVTRRFDSTGAPVGNDTLVDQFGPGAPDAVAGLSDGGYIVAWSFTGAGWTATRDFLLQRFDQSGAPVGGRVAGSDLSHIYNRPFAPDVAGLSDGGYVVAWEAEARFSSANMDVSEMDPSGTGIYVQRFDSAGARMGGEVLVNTNTSGSQSRPAVAALPAGGYMVAWDSEGQDGSGTGIYMQRFDAGGARAGQEVLVNTTTDGLQWSPTIAPLQDGGYVIGWVSEGQDGSGTGIYSQRFDATGLPKAPPAPQDTTGPAAIDFFPAAGSSMLPPDWSLGITFDEPVQPGAGTITLQTAAGAVVQTFAAASDPGIQFAGASVIIDPAADLQPGTTYKLIVSAEAVLDLAGNAYAGASGHSFTTAGSAPPGGDTTAPLAIDFFPAAGSNMLPPDWSLGITFDEAVKAGAGTITLQTAAGSVLQTFATASDPGIQFTGSSVIINPAADLMPGTTYRLVVSADAVLDLAGNAYAGVGDYGFTTAGEPPPTGDTIAPVAIDFFPAAGSNMLPPTWSPGVTFSEPVQAGSGTITLQTGAGETVQTFSAGDPGVRFFGASVVIDPAADLLPGVTYRLIVGADALQDLAGNAYAGVSDYSFTTAGAMAVEATLVGVPSQELVQPA